MCPSILTKSLGEGLEIASTQDKNFCLQRTSDGSLELKRTHAYYYQIQTQLFVCNADYCDLCVSTFSLHGDSGLHIERVAKDEDFWCDCVLKAEVFFQNLHPSRATGEVVLQTHPN